MQLEVGKIYEGKVTGITKFGAFIDLGENRTGMVHISEVAPTFVKEITDFISMTISIKPDRNFLASVPSFFSCKVFQPLF